jgi:Tol biopolymer transport system component
VKRTTLVLTVFTAAMVMALVMVAMALPALAGGADDNEDSDNESASGGATRNGQIVFRRYFDPDQTKGAIFTMNPDGSHIRQITHPPKGWRDDAPTWSPDGKHVAFYRQRIDERMSRIMVFNTKTGDVREVTHCGPDQGWTKEHPPPSSGHYCVADFDPSWAPDGNSISFRRILGPDRPCCRIEGIWIIGLDGSNPHQVTNVDPKLPEEFSDFGPAFSPDGKTLVIDRQQTKKAPKLVKLGEEEPYYHAVFVQSLHSSGSPEDAHRITPWKLNCQDHPEYSPDGKLILFRCLPKGEQGPSNLYWVHPDGTGLHQLTQAAAQKQTYWYGGSSFSPSFSEGEGWIAVGRAPGYGKKGNADVFRVRIEEGELVRKVNLTKSTIWDSNPNWGTHPPVG